MNPGIYHRIKRALQIGATISALAIHSPSDAQTIALENPSFEEVAVSDGSYVTTVPKWTSTGTVQTSNPANNWFSNTTDTVTSLYPIDGRNIALVNAPGSLSQVLQGVSIRANATYTLTLLVGQRMNEAFGTPSIAFQSGTQILAQTNITAPGPAAFVQVSLRYTAPPSGPIIGSPLSIILQSSGANAQVGFDYVRVTSDDGVCTPRKATAVAQVVNGFFVGATMTDSGCGYTNPPIVVIEGGGGAGAIAQAIVSNGKVTALQVVNPGCCYTNAPKIIISAPPTVPTIQIAVTKIKVIQNVVLGWKYVLESSTDGITWLPTGPEFTAQNDPIETEFDSTGTNRLFRLRVVN